MATIGIRELSRRTPDVLREVQDTGAPLVITKRGEPIAAIVPVNERQAEAFLLAESPAVQDVRSATDAEMASGSTRPIDDVLAEIDVEEGREREGVPAPELLYGVVAAFGPDATDAAQAAADLARMIADEVAPKLGAASTDEARVVRVNALLLGELLPAAALEEARRRAASPPFGAAVFGGVQETTLAAAAAAAREVNEQVLTAARGATAELTLDAYEIAVRTAAGVRRSAPVPRGVDTAAGRDPGPLRLNLDRRHAPGYTGHVMNLLLGVEKKQP